MPTVSILGLSMLLQYVAAVLAFRLRRDGASRAWYLIALAILLMAVRRTVTLTRYLAGHTVLPDAWAESVALAISVLMVAALAALRPFFRRTAEATANLRKSEEYLASLLANASDVIMVVDREGRIVYESPATERVFGYAQEERKGGSIYEGIHPEDRARVRRALRGGFRRPGALRALTVRMQASDGTWRTIDAIGWVRTDVEGELRAIVNCRDVTEARAAEAAATRLGRVLDGSLNEIYLFDAETLRFEFVNEGARRQLGYSMDELSGLTPLDLKPEFTRADFDALIAPLRSGARPRIRFRTVHQRKDGSRYPVEVHLQLLERERSPIFAAIILDLTEQAKASEEKLDLERQLRRAQRLESIGTLAGGIAHDFNNILMPLLGYLDMARAKLQGDGDVQSDLEKVAMAAERARELVQGVLTFSREVEQDRRAIDLREAVGEALDLLRASLPSTIDFRASLGDAPCTVLADPTQMHQIVLNLCTNAAHAMHNVGVLDVRLDECEVRPGTERPHPRLHAGIFARLSVRDTGCGMDAITQERIFEPFFTTKQTQEGSGLGLAVVHGIVQSHGGAITVESAAGEGSCFVVYLPRIESRADAGEDVAGPLPRGPGRVLFVDDEDAIRALGRQMLATLDYHVETCADAEAALGMLQDDPEGFDVLVTDQTMPGMTGIELSSAARRIRPDLPTILTTGYSEAVSSERVQPLGIHALLHKPFGQGDLARAVAGALRARARAPRP